MRCSANHPRCGELRQQLIARTEGNPFFLEECVRTLVETGALVGEGGAYQLSHSVQAIQIPATVQVILAARIDRLAPEDKHLLQAAAVIGKDVPFALLAGSRARSNRTRCARLFLACSGRVVYEAALFPDSNTVQTRVDA